MKFHFLSCLPCLDLWPFNTNGTTNDDDLGDDWWDPGEVSRRVNDPEALRRFLKKRDDECDGWVQLHGPIIDIKDAVTGIEDVVAAMADTVDWLECVEGLLEAFAFYDRDGDGVISAGDLQVALRDVVGGAEEEEEGGRSWEVRCEEMVRVFDREKVGGVCFDDFVVMLSSN